MNEQRKEELLTRWLDDALTDEEVREFEPVLAEHPEWRAERESYRKLRSELVATIPAEVEPPYPDFFNVHLQRLVENASRRDRDPSRSTLGLGRLWTWWLAPAAAAAVVAAFILGMNSAPMQPPGVVDAQGSEVYSPLSNVSTEVIQHDEALGATLIVVEGLDELSDDDLVVGDGSLGGQHGYYVVTHGEVY